MEDPAIVSEVQCENNPVSENTRPIDHRQWPFNAWLAGMHSLAWLFTWAMWLHTWVLVLREEALLATEQYL